MSPEAIIAEQKLKEYRSIEEASKAQNQSWGRSGLQPPDKPDPNGFMKWDSDKPMPSLVDPDFILGVADILTFGAKKYAKNNWQLNTDIDRYKDSLMRHIYAYLGGELIDPESGKPHLDHIACNVMFLRYFEHGKGH